MLTRLRLRFSRISRHPLSGRAFSRRRPAELAHPTGRWHSVSSCSEYEKCPRRYRYGYVERLAEDRPVPASWRHGSVVHRALEVSYRAQAAGAPLASTEPIALDALRAEWIAEDLPDDNEWRARSEQVVRSALTNGNLVTDHILGVEHGFRAVMDERLRFAGFADLVLRRDATTIEIVDHKITRYARDESALATDPQLNLYGWFALREWPWARRVLATHHYPVLDRTVTVELTEESMAHAVTRLARIAVHAEDDELFAPRPSAECANCPWIARCPAHQENALVVEPERYAQTA